MCNTCALSAATPTDELSEHLLEVVNHGALALMISLGHRTGLLKTMARLDEPATSREIADAARLNERYVREWLGAMVCAKIVLLGNKEDGNETRYRLPPEHADLLAPENPAENMCVLMQYMGVLGSVEMQVEECFRKGGGVPYSAFPRFHELMADDSFQWAVAPLFDHILPLIPEWRPRLEEGATMLDAGCGRGRALNTLAAAFPDSFFVGCDINPEAVEFAAREAAEKGLRNVRFEVRDLTTFDEDAEPESFDFITTFDAVHDQARPDRFLRGAARALKTDGFYLMVDIAASSLLRENLDHPIGPFLYTISTMHCMTVSLAEGGMGLGTVWGHQKATRMLREAGFRRVERTALENDFQNYYYISRKTA